MDEERIPRHKFVPGDCHLTTIIPVRILLLWNISFCIENDAAFSSYPGWFTVAVVVDPFSS